MADPILDQMLDPTPPTPPPAPDPSAAAPPAPTGVTIDPAEYERLKKAADAFEQAAPILDDLRAGRFNQAPPVPPPPAADANPDDQFWTSPTQAAEKLIDQKVTPYARQIAAQLAGMAIATFKSNKATDRMYAGAVSHFDREMGRVDKSWLGSLPPEGQLSVLETAWNAATGAYVNEYQAKNPPRPTPPPNIGGGGSAGGGGGHVGKRSLQEIDPVTYNMAIQAGWSQERMDSFAAKLLEEQE